MMSNSRFITNYFFRKTNKKFEQFIQDKNVMTRQDGQD